MKLNKYIISLELMVYGENEDDAIDYANSAIDASDILHQDGVISINILEDETYEYEEDSDMDE